ncbi:class I SAM-dependent methyltransferase [Streptomyces sp. CBMA123]|uniref:class I SAM-dependent methyltransferase n=1 Tax=Streptomyces sp. CBMA123 TaxID=1896313 RepID=UPI00166209AF|nr:hypothetical protein [Streptomyces sp. CBMA123]
MTPAQCPEVRNAEALREHYARTIDAWHDNLRDQRAELTALVGAATVRLWQLYLAGSSPAFAERRMGVDQILAVRPAADGTSGAPATAGRWYRGQP